MENTIRFPIYAFLDFQEGSWKGELLSLFGAQILLYELLIGEDLRLGSGPRVLNSPFGKASCWQEATVETCKLGPRDIHFMRPILPSEEQCCDLY